jgi:NADH dehydrogenase
MAHAERDTSVVVVGGGFAGVGCAKALAKAHVPVTLIDQHNYHTFQPMLYQVATAQLASSDVARSLRGIFRKDQTVAVKMAEVTGVDPATRTVHCADGSSFSGDYLVLAMGSRANYFDTPGAPEHTIALYALDDAQRLRTRVLEVFEDADRNPQLLDKGALNFVIIGAGATGVETAGALADLINEVMVLRYHDLDVGRAEIHLIDPGQVVLGPFSDKAHEYASKVLRDGGVKLRLGLTAKAIQPDRVVLSDGSEILTRTVVWAGGLQAASLAGHAGLPQGRGGRLEVSSDLTVDGHPGVYAVGDVANIAGPDGRPFPQLGSVALQAGQWAAKNILADLDGHSPEPFKYHDKGIMAMIGRNAAVAEMGEHRHELHGGIAFAAWLGVHAYLLTGVRQRIDAFVSWGWDYFSKSRSSGILDRPDSAQIDWDEDEDDEGAGAGAGVG